MKPLKGSSSSFVAYLVQCLAISSALSFCAYAQESQEAKVLNVDNEQKPLNVDGEGLEEDIVDGELQFLDNELKKQGRQIKLNAKKTQKYKKLQNTTEKLSDTTEKYVEEKKVSEKGIKEYNQKIKCLLDESGTDPDCDAYRKEDEKKPAVVPVVTESKVEDQASVQQAAPQQNQNPSFIIQNILPEQKEEVQVEPKSNSPEVIPLSIDTTIEKELPKEQVVLEAYEKLKIYPYVGLSTYDGTGVSGIQSNALLGIRFESKPFAGRFAMGAGISYRQLTARDSGSQLNFNPFVNMAPEFELDNMAVDVYGKLIIIKDSSFMPYIMGGFGYNMMSIQYRDNNTFGFNNFGAPANIQRNYVNATFGGGIDYAFTPAIGANLELNYARSISSLNNQTSANLQGVQGQSDLNNLANNFANASLFSIQAGLIVFF